jgi:hypothetical protein
VSGYATIFHIQFQDELFKAEKFSILNNARRCCQASCRDDYKSCRPHVSLDSLPPLEFGRRRSASASATLQLQQHSKYLTLTHALLAKHLDGKREPFIANKGVV